MTLSLPSHLAGAPAIPPAGHAGGGHGAKAAPGFHDGFLACLSRDQALPAHEVPGAPAPARPPAIPGQPVVTPAPAAQVLTPVPARAIPADDIATPAKVAGAAVANSDAADPALPMQDQGPTPDSPADPLDGAAQPDTSFPGEPKPKAAGPQAEAAPARPKGAARAAGAKPEAEPAAIEKPRQPTEGIVALAQSAPAEPARGILAPAARPGSAREGVIGQGAAPPAPRGEGQAAQPSARPRPDSMAMPNPAPSPVMADAPALAMPAPAAMPQDVQRPGAATPATTAPVVMTDRADWPQTVVSATLATLMPDGGTMTLEITPEELGALRITLTLEGDTASVSIQTETPEAARLLNAAEPQLAQDFARQGVTLSAHDAQTGRRGDPGPQTPGHAAHAADDTPPSDPAPLMRPQGLVNLIA